MNESLRRFAFAFILTLLILTTAIAGLLAFDRMDREIGGIPRVEENEMMLGRYTFAFDLSGFDTAVENVRTGLQWIGGIPYALFEVVIQGSKWVSDTLFAQIF